MLSRASFAPIERTDLIGTIITPLYGDSENASLESIHPHRLSIFFGALASGAYYERVAYSVNLAKQYHILARAAFSLETIMREANTASVQAFVVILWFMRVSDPQSHQERWILGGVCAKLAQIVSIFYLIMIFG